MNINPGHYTVPTGCPNEDLHTPMPHLSYLGWFDWAEKIGETHKQVKCRGCGRYKIWIPKRATLKETQ